MKIPINLLFLFFLVMTLNGCKTDSVSGEGNEVDKTIPSQLPEAPESIEVIFPDSLFNNHTWKVQTILENGQVSTSTKFEGSELKLLSDGTFSWTGEKISHEGSYSFDQNQNLLKLDSNDPDQSSEWTVKNRRRFMVLIGTVVNDQSNLQMSLVR